VRNHPSHPTFLVLVLLLDPVAIARDHISINPSNLKTATPSMAFALSSSAENSAIPASLPSPRPLMGCKLGGLL
jgi:hypothetical protein